jgi:conjugal transfer pilus assembly protein TraF
MSDQKNKIQLIIFFVLVINQWFLMNAVTAESKAKGWHWYNEVYLQDKKEEKKKDDKISNEQAKEARTKKKENTAVEQIIILRKIVDEAKAKAILYPTLENLREYIMLQNYVVNQATLFSRVWQKALLEYPELDFSIEHPNQNSFQHLVHEEKIKKEENAVKEYSKSYGLFFFYRGNNKIDEALSETVKEFSERHDITLIPITVDDKTLSIFKTSKIDSGQAKALNVKYFPALILVDPISQKNIPLNYGYISYSGLLERFLQLATDFKKGE